MSKYDDVAADLQRRIENQEFAQTRRIPTLEELMESYQVSRNTARNAIKKLTEQGYLYARQGSGVFVRPKPSGNCIPLTGTNGLAHDFPNSVFETIVEKVELIPADEQTAEKMLCKAGTPIYHVERVRIIDGRKFALEYSLYNKDIIQYLSEDIASRSIYSYLKNDMNLKFGFADKHVTARKLTSKEASQLDLEEGDPVLIISDTVYLDDGRLFNCSDMLYNYKYADFYATANDSRKP